ncbi:MAG TPA: threonine--tRNA ligase [Candidatus Sulfotelmatobacter sp.]|nr:threonine--tRNA ligase [Candidatus Sulfotelmatobacter sp.]
MADAILVMPDGREVPGAAGQPLRTILEEAGIGWRGRVVAAQVDGRTVDLGAPAPAGARVPLLAAESPEGLQVVRHSTAHLMAAAVQQMFPEARFAIGPAIDDGFYYDMALPRALTPEDLPGIEGKMRELAAQNLPYVRREVPLDEALARVRAAGQDFKVEILEEIRRQGAFGQGGSPRGGTPSGERVAASGELAAEADPGATAVSFYETGSFVDLCRGPHVPDTSALTAFRLTHLAGAYWRGDERRPMLQRIYGTAFASAEALERHLQRIEEAKRRDHRRLGRELDLFSVDEDVGGGLILWHPKGGILRVAIEDFWRREHLANGYHLVFSPHVGRARLWETSGHLDFYRENMYAPMEMEGNDYYVKPMNCPFHIKMYQSRVRSYRELPLRLAELGTVYRFERAGVLHGLLRVRGFTQDDAHIFCTPEQVEAEIARAVEFSLFFLRAFGFEEYEAYIATRPEKFVGDPADWDRATQALRGAAARAGLKVALDEGGGAFYGPKIDLKIKDTLGRPWQCTTVQFDFNLPDRFDIAFVGEDNRQHRPFMVHRALLGSMERFLGVLIEHYAGAFPVWLAPVQARVLPIADRHTDFGEQVAARLRAAGARAEVDARSEKIGHKIREAEMQKIPYCLVVGDREMAGDAVSVRGRGGRDLGGMSVAAFLDQFRREAGPPTAPAPGPAPAEGGSAHR